MPTPVFLRPPILFMSVEVPIATLPEPVVLHNIALFPIATFPSPDVLFLRAQFPTAMLHDPVLLDINEPLPMDMFSDAEVGCPGPLPMFTPFAWESREEVKEDADTGAP